MSERRFGRTPGGVSNASNVTESAMHPEPRALVGCGLIVRRAFVFRLHPTSASAPPCWKCVESHRELYNDAFAERRDAWERSKTRIRYVDQSGQLTDIRSVRPDPRGVVLFPVSSLSLWVTHRRRENGGRVACRRRRFLGLWSPLVSLVPGPDLEGSRTVASSTPVRISVPLTEAPRRAHPMDWFEFVWRASEVSHRGKRKPVPVDKSAPEVIRMPSMSW